MTQLIVGVLMGGTSLEREVSLNSGRTICDHLDTEKYTVIPLFQTSSGTLYILPERFLHRGKISDFEHRLTNEAEKITWDALRTRVEFMYIAQHGRSGEDGTLQGMLEVLGIPYVGSKVFASALGMNKNIQKQFLATAGISVPQGIVVASSALQVLIATQTAPADLAYQLATLNYPLVIKPLGEGSSFGVSIITQPDELITALIHASTIAPDIIQDVIVEEKIEGMEFTCIVITNAATGELEALPPTEIIPESTSTLFDYEQKYMPGRSEKHTPARCSPEDMKLIQDTCIATMRALGMQTLGRIDGFLTSDHRVIIIDPNTFSGMAPSSFAFVQAAQHGMSHTNFINHLIATEIQAYTLNTTLMKNYHATSQTPTTAHKIRVAVLLGGASNEKEISLESGRNIVYKLSPQKYAPLPLFVDSFMRLYHLENKQLVLNSTKEIQASLRPEQEILWSMLPNLADFVFIALHGGAGENGSVQGALEMLKMPYNGSSILASALCMNKYATNRFLATKGIAVPRGMLIEKSAINRDIATLKEQIVATVGGFPLIVKPHDDGCSVLVSKVYSVTELEHAVATIFEQGKSTALIEECISGMELTIGVIGNEAAQALPPSQAVATGGILSIEEKFLPGAGENQTPAPLPEPALKLAQRTVEQAYEAVECKGYARIDCFYQQAELSPTGAERVVIIEINTLPGMTPATCIFHQAAELGIKPMEFVDKIITLGFEQHRTAQPFTEQKKQLQQIL